MNHTKALAVFVLLSQNRCMAITQLPEAIRQKWEAYEWRHACTILRYDFPEEWEQIVRFLETFQLKTSDFKKRGGNKSPISAEIDAYFIKRCGWEEKGFKTEIVIDNQHKPNPTHKIDCYKNCVGLELEWNNKDPFYDRDLNNFRILFDLRAISVGVIVTRCDELQDIANVLGKKGSYGNSTTHMSKLLNRVQGGGGGGCPLLVLGISKAVIADDLNEVPEAILYTRFHQQMVNLDRQIVPDAEEEDGDEEEN